MKTTERAAVLITGCSSGIGAATASRLGRHGWMVFAGVRRAADAGALLGTPNVRPVVLDVRDAPSVAGAVEEVRWSVDPDLPFSVVSNAGYALPGPLEDIDVDDVGRQIDVNALGMLRVVKAALPLVRSTGGRIVTIGSMSGRVAMPFTGPYAASKFALRALSDALRVELAPWGIPVCLIEPGNVATPIWQKARALHAHQGAPSNGHHAAARAATERAFGRIAARAMDADVVAAAVERALTDRRPRAHAVVGTAARVIIALDRWLPTDWRDALVRRRLGLGGMRRRAAEPTAVRDEGWAPR